MHAIVQTLGSAPLISQEGVVESNIWQELQLVMLWGMSVSYCYLHTVEMHAAPWCDRGHRPDMYVYLHLHQVLFLASQIRPWLITRSRHMLQARADQTVLVHALKVFWPGALVDALGVGTGNEASWADNQSADVLCQALLECTLLFGCRALV